MIKQSHMFVSLRLKRICDPESLEMSAFSDRIPVQSDEARSVAIGVAKPRLALKWDTVEMSD